MRHEHNQPGLPQKRAFSRHVRAGQQQESMGVEVQVGVIGDESFRQVELLNHRMATIFYEDDPSIVHVRFDVAVSRSHLRKSRENVE